MKVFFKESHIREIEKINEDLQLNITGEQVEQLALYTELILKKSERVRITGEKTALDFIGKQIYDSIYVFKVMTIADNSMVLDLGSGGGVPGIPLKICCPLIKMTLMDSSRKKTEFLQDVVKMLALDKTKVLHGRAEDWARHSENREKYDYVFSKAVAVMATMAELALPFAKVGGSVVLYKGPAGAKEAFEAKRALEMCGGTIEREWQYCLLSGEERRLYLLKKILKTPDQYPRQSGKPKKRPIRSLN